jgi:hypothetical protein
MGPRADPDAVEKREIFFPHQESNPTAYPDSNLVAIPTELSKVYDIHN